MDPAEPSALDPKAGLAEALRGHVRKLAVEIGERTAGRPGSLDRAAGYIRDSLRAAGLAVEDQTYDYHGHRVANVIATPPGAPAGDSFFVVGAHYDTVPFTPGADDNASGVAALIELARRMARRPVSIPLRLVAFTLEEPPAHFTADQGSRVYVESLIRSGARPRGAIVLEMVGFTSPRQGYPAVLRWAGYPDHGRFIGIVGNWRSRRFGRTVKRGFEKNPRLAVESLFVPLNGWVLPDTRLSDHASFWDQGIAAVMVTDTAFFRNPNYHLPSDRMETLDFAFMAELVESLALALEELGGLA